MRRRIKKPKKQKDSFSLLEQYKSDYYKSDIQSVPADKLLEEVNKTNELSKFVRWMEESDVMDESLSEKLEKLLDKYRMKIRLLAYAITRARLTRIAEAVSAEEDILSDIMDSVPYVGNTEKIRLLQTLSEIINTGMESINELAGLAETPEDVLSSLKGHFASSETEFGDLKPDEREKLRVFFDSLINNKEPTKVGDE